MNPIAVPLQIVAVRFEGGNELHHVVEHLVYDEQNGLVQAMSREDIVTYLNKYGFGSVFTRNSDNTRAYVFPFERNGRHWVRTTVGCERWDRLYTLYRYPVPQPNAETWHVVSVNYSRDRTLSSVFDLIVRSDRTGEAKLLSREAISDRVRTAPGRYVIETPRTAHRPLLCTAIAGKEIVSAANPLLEGPDPIFALPRHLLNMAQL
jgi:hypothetical protein